MPHLATDEAFPACFQENQGIGLLASTQANDLRTAHVEQCFGTNGVPLRKSGRLLLGEGLLTKVCRKSAKPRQFFLFSDILVYGSIVQERKKYNKQHVIPLRGIGIISLPDTADLQHAWVISSERKSFVVFAATALEKAEWINHLAEASNTRPAVSAADEHFACHAPTWTPDQQATACMRCNVTRFSNLKRRHHCRKCGLVVCSACSTRRLLLPVARKPVRVCDVCFDAACKTEPEVEQGTAADGATDSDQPDAKPAGNTDSDVMPAASAAADSAAAVASQDCEPTADASEAENVTTAEDTHAVQQDVDTGATESPPAGSTCSLARVSTLIPAQEESNPNVDGEEDDNTAPTPEDISEGRPRAHTDLSSTQLARASRLLSDLTLDAPTTFYDASDDPESPADKAPLEEDSAADKAPLEEDSAFGAEPSK